MSVTQLPQHISHQFDKELEDVRGRVLEMGGGRAPHDALADGNPGLAELAASNDYKANTMEIDIDADCTAILARLARPGTARSPVRSFDRFPNGLIPARDPLPPGSAP